MGFVTMLTFSTRRADESGVLWLALIWVALLMLWGASEQWGLADAGRRLARSVHFHERADKPSGD